MQCYFSLGNLNSWALLLVNTEERMADEWMNPPSGYLWWGFSFKKINILRQSLTSMPSEWGRQMRIVCDCGGDCKSWQQIKYAEIANMTQDEMWQGLATNKATSPPEVFYPKGHCTLAALYYKKILTKHAIFMATCIPRLNISAAH